MQKVGKIVVEPLQFTVHSSQFTDIVAVSVWKMIPDKSLENDKWKVVNIIAGELR